MDSTKYYVFYDGECGFCNYWVHWILQNDHKDLFRFAALQSDFGQDFLLERGLESRDLNTLYLWKPGKFYLIKSQAIMKIAKLLGGKYAFLSYLNIFPVFFSDRMYDLIATKRNRLVSSNCLLPKGEEKKKFIS